MLKFILSIFVFFLAFTPTVCRADGEARDQFLEARKYEKDELYDMSFDVLCKIANEYQDNDCISEFTNFIKKRLNSLPDTSKLSISSPDTTKIVYDYQNVSFGPRFSPEILLLPVLPSTFSVYNEFQREIIKSEIIKNLKNDTERRMSGIERIEISKENINKYNKIKSYFKRAIKFAEMIMSEQQYNNKIVHDYKILIRAKEDFIKSRTRYVSYVIISPRLAVASQLVYLAKNENLLITNEDFLRQAAVAMAFTGPLLKSANEDVRVQFAEVYRELKDAAGKVQLDEYKVITTLIDKIGNGELGGEVWYDSDEVEQD
ncbi:MAG: hypothetical protein ACEB74_05970 [Desulfovibrio aminophilus]|uniref:hypothetical protein n=1 Tax=Desulfovibrio aminophilus TaxID=81425 RepID=UPI0039EBF348